MVFFFFKKSLVKGYPFLLFGEGIKERKKFKRSIERISRIVWDCWTRERERERETLFFSNMTTDTRCAIMLESGAISMAAVLSCVSARRERDDSTNGDKASRGCQPVKEPRRAASKSAGTSLYSHHVDRPLPGCRITKLSNQFFVAVVNGN